MTIDQLIAAIERRGYLVQMYPPREGDGPLTIEIWRNNGPVLPGTPGEVRSMRVSMLTTAPSIGEVAETFLTALSAGQHHMACARCNEPLLERKEQQASSAEYRSAKAGPDSPILTSCPHCHQSLTTGSVKEIDDLASDADAYWAERRKGRG